MRPILVCLLFLFSPLCFAQSIQTLDSLIEAGVPQKSLELIQHQVLALEKSKKYGGLADYLEVFGRAYMEISDEKRANEQVEIRRLHWESLLQKPQDLKNLWLAQASWYEYIGELEKSYQAELQAVNFAKMEQGITPKELGKLMVNLGALSINRLDLKAAKVHLSEAEILLNKDPDPESIYRINSFLGNMAYFASKMDSAEYFFKKCLLTFESMEPSPRNSHYRPAIVLNNLSGVQAAQGKITESIQSMNETIAHLKLFQEKEKDPSQRMSGREFYFQAIDNLGGIYKGLGNFRKAQDLLEFSYQKKKETFGSDSKEVWLSEILLGQLYFEQEEPEKARRTLDKGLRGLKETSGSYQLYEADGWYTLARIEDAAENDALALEYYHRADSLFKQSLEGEFDVIYLGFLKNYALFLAENGKESLAITQAQIAYEYVRKNQGDRSLMSFQQKLSMGDVFFELRRYEEAQSWSEKALTTLTGQFHENRSLLDSLQLERNKPQALLLNAKARFEIHGKKDPTFLKSLLVSLESGLEILDRRKIFLENEEDINLMIRENEEYFKFVEQIYLELYQKTGQKDYLSKLLSLHESALYQRIRARLEQVGRLRFGDVPQEFFAKETELKSNLKTSIEKTENGVEEYLKASKTWENFLSETRKNYPEYFDFRYASIQRDYEFNSKQLPEETAVIRFLFVQENLYAIVLGKSEPQLFKLDFKTAEEILNAFQNEWSDERKTLSNLHQLYLSLWAPLEKAINQQRVVIVPDGILFNLNFEILTPQKLNSFADLAKGSLLSNHSISYHYSTLLFSYRNQDQFYSSNFTAFAPGFFDEMKEGYLKSVQDSLQIDKSYLTLIPQPFTDRLVNKLKTIFGGKIFTKDASTLDQFNQESGKHMILHIGTHAESNNISPDFSRLIFAKSNGRPAQENSLFARDIYQLNLSSELAVLMACETGKPTFAPGEGMISLAHAFNYAGSKSLLMGIWKIDEQVSAQIAESFYFHLSEGKTKDKALQLAKLEYLAQADGRSLSPEFWAGLIVMGDASPIDFEPVIDVKLWILTGTGILIIGILAFWFFKRRNFKALS